ncbi:MAG: hypothetical protein KAU21_08430 [Gammaproteobacteria bacterium]|nr:hypothetical protein [Gammaproteobacteria bacterium]
MAFSSYFIVIFIASIFFVLGVLFISKIHKNTHHRREMREILLKRIEILRLPKMLQALGISFANYFFKVSVDEIDKCVTHCEICSSPDLCDEKLKLPELNPSDIDFCPCQQHLSKFSRANRIKSVPEKFNNGHHATTNS